MAFMNELYKQMTQEKQTTEWCDWLQNLRKTTVGCEFRREQYAGLGQ